MATVVDLAARRDNILQSLGKHRPKLENALANGNLRKLQMVRNRAVDDVTKFREMHQSYLNKCRETNVIPDDLDIDELISDKLDDLLDDVDIAIEEKIESEEAEENYTSHMESLTDEVERTAKRCELLKREMEDSDSACSNAMEAVLSKCEKDFAETKQGLQKSLKGMSEEKRKAARNKITEVGALIEGMTMEVKKLAARTGLELSFTNRPASSTTPSERSSSPVNANKSMIKKKTVDFPRFDGDLRAYTTWKRDFLNLCGTDSYDENHMSLIIRSQCLQGKAKDVCKNIQDYKKLWAKLDEVYYDPVELGELISKEIESHRKLTDDDTAGFIKYVDMLNKAHIDLIAADEVAILEHRLVMNLILKKCPDWAQNQWIQIKIKDPLEASKFEFLLKFLQDKSSEAREKMKLQPGTPNRNNQEKKKGNINVVNGQNKGKNPRDGQTKVIGKHITCLLPGCNQNHYLSDCPTWRGKNADEKGEVVKDKKLCIMCFSPKHAVKDCPRKANWAPCGVAGCVRWHSKHLHGATTPGLVLAMNRGERAWLLTQWMETQSGEQCAAMWDLGANVSLVTFDFAKRARLNGSCCEFEMVTVNDQSCSKKTKLFTVPVVRRDGKVENILAYGMEKIVSHWVSPPSNEILRQFGKPVELADKCFVSGEIELLIGTADIELYPRMMESHNGVTIFESEFGIGWCLAGKVPNKRGGKSQVMANSVMKIPDFLTAEGLGVELPKRCKACNQCKECAFKAVHLSWQENQELKCIEEGLELDVEKKKWIAQYPFQGDPNVLVNNKPQAIAMLKNLEKRLISKGQMEEFNAQFQDTVQRGVFKLVTEQNYQGTIFYISMVDAYKTGPNATTPVRLCMNSSLKYAGNSLNDLLMKGPSALNEIIGVTLHFRTHKIGFIKDLSKFYQSILVCERDKHLCRVLWRDGDTAATPKEYTSDTVNFGMKPAGCMSQVALRKTAQMYRSIHPKAADQIISDTYVDDTMGGGDTVAEVIQISEAMDEIVSRGGFSYKPMVKSGDKLMEGGEHPKVLGTGWSTEDDTLFVDAKINFGDKKKGLKSAKNIDPDEVLEEAPAVITKRMIWRVALGQYDVLGLVSPFLIRLKLMMRDLVQDTEDKKEWDDAVSETQRFKFLELISQLKKIRDIRFPRCIVPEKVDRENSEATLMTLVDGSRSASCALVYICWKLVTGEKWCILVAGKTRVAPIKRISIPRMELNGALAGVRLAEKVQEHLGIEIKQRFFFTDSSAVLGMLKGNLSTYQEFVSTRTSEIKSKTDTVTEWKWIPSEYNLADLGTRDTVVPEDLCEASAYQNGMAWMKDDPTTWPELKEKPAIPAEELLKQGRKVMLCMDDSLLDLKRYGSFTKAVRVIMIITKWRKVHENRKNEDAKTAAEEYLFKNSQQEMIKNFREDKYVTLRPRLMQCSHQDGEIIVVSGRLGDNLTVGYDKLELPLLEPSSRLAYLIMKEAHEKFHSGVDRTVQVSRGVAWIIRGAVLAKTIIKYCQHCKLKNKKLAGQLMGQVPREKLPPSTPFSSTAIDLFGPFKIRDTVKFRVTREVYGVMFCCLTTSAVHIEVMDDYSTDMALMAIRRFFAIRGTPNFIQSDPGTQLKAAGKIVQLWDCTRICEFAKTKNITWKIIPTNSQHYNGAVEAMIKSAKICLKQIIGVSPMTKGEIDTVLSEVMQKLNSRPLMVRAGSDTESMGPITPNHLLSGRASMEIPEINTDGQASLTKRLRFVDEISKQFWNKWFKQVFHKLVPSPKWNTEKRNAQVGDTILLKEESMVQSKYKLGRIAEVYPGVDNRVRRVKIEYRNASPNSKMDQMKKMFTERSVNNIVVICPADYSADEMEAEIRKNICL